VELLCDAFASAEYRVTPELKLDAGTVTNLYPTFTTPTAVIMRRWSGRDRNISGIHATDMTVARDFNSYASTVFVDSGGGTGSDTVAPTWKDINGNTGAITKYVSETGAVGNETATAAQQRARIGGVRRQITLSSDIYDVVGDIRCGDSVWVYDPELGLLDTANQIQYRGQLVFPISVRVFGFTWPIRAGMGVYFVASNATGADGAGATITDLSDWVAFEDSDVTLEVGANPARLSLPSFRF
jgi:hypothetical protein